MLGKLSLLCLVFAFSLMPAAAQEATPAADAAPSTIAQTFIQNLIDGDFEAATANFDSGMLENAPPEVLQQIWGQIRDQLGALVSVGEPRYDATSSTVRIEATFENAVVDFVVPFNAENQITGFFIQPPQNAEPTPVPDFAPPPYADQSAFTEIEVIVGEDTDYPLAGTLTLPNSENPVAAVVLVHGSGPNDRDSTVGPNKMFRDIAWGLASQGIAVLRYDKRTLVFPDRIDMQTVTVQEETIDDALLAIDLLRRTEGIDPARIFLAGHSLGGYLAPRIAQSAPDLAGVILLAGSANPLEDLVARQVRYLAELDGEVTDQEAQTIAAIDGQVAAVKALQPGDTLEDPLLGIPAAYWLDLQDYDPIAVAVGLPQPMLILQGERDYQVTMADEFVRWQAVAGSRANVTSISYATLNHLFLPGEGAPNPDEYNTPGHVPAVVIDDIAAWIDGLGAGDE